MVTAWHEHYDVDADKRWPCAAEPCLVPEVAPLPAYVSVAINPSPMPPASLMAREGLISYIAELEARTAALRIETAALTAALEKYGQHPKTCKRWWIHQIEGDTYMPERPCTCGLDAARGTA